MKQKTRQGVQVTLDELIRCRFAANALDLSSSQRVMTLMAGGYRSVLRGRGMDFNEVRVYQAGDDIRNMDWCVTARTGQPHTKLYHEEKERPVYFLVDLNAHMYFATRGEYKAVVAAKAAAILAWAAVNNGDRIGAVVTNGVEQWSSRPRSRKHGILPLLKHLSDVTQNPDPEYDPDGLAKALWHCRHVIHPGSVLFVISDFSGMNEEAERHISRIGKNNVVVGLDIYDRLEMRLPDADLYQVSNGSETMTIDTSQNKAVQQYHQEFMLNKMKLGKLCKRYHIPLLKLATHENCGKVLLRHFGSKGLQRLAHG